MWFYIPAAIIVVAFGFWFSRTNLFRHQLHGQSKDPGQMGAHPGGWNENGGGGI